MDADLIAKYEQLQLKATALKRIKKVVDGQLKELQPKILEYGQQNNKDSISAPSGGKIVIKQRPASSSISFKQMGEALKAAGTFLQEDDQVKVVDMCKTHVAREKKQGSKGYTEYLLPHPNIPGKTIQQKDVALPAAVEQNIMKGLDHVMKTQKLEIAKIDAPKKQTNRKRSKSAGSGGGTKKKAKGEKAKNDDATHDDEEDMH